MKALTILIFLTIFTSAAQAQVQSPKQKEIGLTISRFSFESIPFDLVYKVGHDNKFWRFEAGSLNASMRLPEIDYGTQTIYEKQNNAGLGFRVAREKRKSISDNFTFFHGIEFGISGSYSERIRYNSDPVNWTPSTRKIKDLNYTVAPHIGYSFGAMFDIKENLYLSFELSPSAYYQLSIVKSNIDYPLNPTRNTVTERLTHNTGFNLTQGAVSLGLFYRI